MGLIKDIQKGLGIGIGIILVFGFLFGLVFAAGLHTPAEILDGTFIGNYIFTGNVDYSGDVDFSSANVSGITSGDSIPSGFIGAFNLANCPEGWKPSDGTSGTLDLRGQFLRGLNTFDGGSTTRSDGNQDSESRALGDFQANGNAAHIHSVNPPSTTTSSNGAHTHSSMVPYNTVYSGEPQAGYATVAGNTGSAGAHTHTLNIAAFDSASSGGNDTRPNNVAVIYCEKE